VITVGIKLNAGVRAIAEAGRDKDLEEPIAPKKNNKMATTTTLLC
jgi:hypothetical protein